MPFLTVVTRVYKRPTLLLANITSLARQTDPDYDQVFLVDEVGRGVQWANGQFYRHRERVKGDYVFMLDDDDRLTVDDFIARLKREAKGRPDAMVVRYVVGGHGVLPEDRHWLRPPACGHIGTANLVVRRDLWQRHIKAFDQPIAGDYHFFTALWPYLADVRWIDYVVGETMRVSHGAPE